jgi:hypothetical protein
MPQPTLPAAATGLPISREQIHVLPRLRCLKSRYTAYAVTDGQDAPVFSPAEFVVADTADTEPVAGGMFLVEWNNGSRSIMETRPTACHRRIENGHSVLSLRKDGPDVCWWFDPIVRPRSAEETKEWVRQGRMMSTSDGPYDLEHMRTKIVGRIVGVVDGEVATDQAIRQISDYNLATDRQARRVAESFDADLLIELRDHTGQVAALVVYPDKTTIMYALVDFDAEEVDRIYKEFEAVFLSERDGHKYSRAKIESALRKAGRVITLKDGQWHADPAMPSHVLAAHFPSKPVAEGGAAA